jgi:hypothetical protein
MIAGFEEIIFYYRFRFWTIFIGKFLGISVFQTFLGISGFQAFLGISGFQAFRFKGTLLIFKVFMLVFH